MIKNIVIIILLILILIFTNYKTVFTQTEVSGNIIKNTTWTKINSPYIVIGIVNVYPGATLTIESGVIVKLDSDISIKIGGELIARGTETDSIFFIQHIDGIRWGTIKFIDSSVDAIYDNEDNYISGSIIEYSRIEGAGNSGIYCETSSQFIHRNTITNNIGSNYDGGTSSYGGAIYCYYGASPFIYRNTIINNIGSNYGGGICCLKYSSQKIYENKITNNVSIWAGGGIHCYWGSSPIIKGNIIDNNRVHQDLLPRGKGGGGIFVWDGSSPIIIGNIISNNTSDENGGGVLFEGINSNPSVSYNNMFGNNPIDICAKENLNATNNWWGTTNKDSISAHIYDYWDNIELGEVHYEPFLTSATPINITLIELKTDNKYLTNLTTLSILDTLYTELIGTDGDTSHQDTTIAYVINESNTDSISVKLIETSLNTGIYRGIAYFSEQTDEGLNILGAEKGDNIKIVSAADNSVYKKFLSVVPVELCLFNANLENNKNIVLNWKTLSETNNFGFEIQRSIDNVNFEKIGFVNGNGTMLEAKSYTFTDENVNSGTHYYSLKQIDFDGSYAFSDVIKVEVNKPKEFTLKQNYPNPFNPETYIKYEIPKISNVEISIYNILGQKIKILLNEVLSPGFYEIIWNGTNEQGVYVSSGVYLYFIKAKDFFALRKMILLR